MEKLKNVLTIWFIVYLMITGLFYLLNTWLVLFPIYLRTLILSGVMVFALQYLIFPALQKISKH